MDDEITFQLALLLTVSNSVSAPNVTINVFWAMRQLPADLLGTL